MRRAIGLAVFSLLALPGRAAGPVPEPTPCTGSDPDPVQRIVQIESCLARRAYRGLSTRGRLVHAEHHDCLRGSFKVREGLPEPLRHGIFAAPHRAPGASQQGAPGDGTYPVWVRLSNGLYADDRDGDSRGMAIKLMQVPGPKLLEGEWAEKETQDFVLLSTPVFPFRDAAGYLDYLKEVGAGDPYSYFGRKQNQRATAALAQATGRPRRALLSETYYSVVTYRVGLKVVRFAVLGEAREEPLGSDGHVLRKTLLSRLVEGPVTLQFAVQVQGDPARTPDDPTVAWPEEDAPFTPVATFTIDREQDQPLPAAQRARLCERLSYNPWHGLQEHQPLGEINRIRKAVYLEEAKARHDHNNVAPCEPDPDGGCRR